MVNTLMDKVYGASDKHTGPWIGESERPDLALGLGRAMWGNKTIYVAEIRPVQASDGLPNVAVFVGEVRERLVEKFGSGADSMFDNKEVMLSLEFCSAAFAEEFDRVIEGDHDYDFMVPAKVKAYSVNHQVKVGDFK